MNHAKVNPIGNKSHSLYGLFVWNFMDYEEYVNKLVLTNLF